MFSDVLSINIDDSTTNETFYETVSELATNEDSNGQNQSQNTSQNTFFSFDSDRNSDTNAMNGRSVLESNDMNDRPVLESNDMNDRPVLESNDMNDRPVLESNDMNDRPVLESNDMNDRPVLESNDITAHIWDESKTGMSEEESQWLDCNEDSYQVSNDVSNEWSLNESQFNALNTDPNDRQENEMRFNRLMQLLDKSKHFSQILVKNMSEQKKSLESKRLNEVKSRSKHSFVNIRKKTNRSCRFRHILTQMNNKTINQNSFDDNESNQTESGLRRSLRKRNSSVLYNDEIDELVNDSDEDRDGMLSDMNPELKDRFFNGSPVDIRQPQLLSGALMRDYQVEGLDWLRLLHQNNINGILADEMGLGKTIQCIALIAHLIESDTTDDCLGPYLVVAPLSTLHNWKLEFERFAPLIPTLLFHGNKKRRLKLRKIMDNLVNIYAFGKTKQCYPVVITSYEVFKFEIGTMKKYHWNYVVIDEGHKIKNINCQLSKLMRKIKSKNRLILTGTPLHNSLSELWSLLNYLSPNMFNDLGIFNEWLASNSSDEQIIQQEMQNKIISSIHQILSPFMLRRTKSEVGLNLPPKKEVLIYAPSSLTQQKLYETAVNLVTSGKTKSDYFTVNCDLSEGRKRRKCVKDINYAKYEKDFEEWFDDEDSNTSLIVNESAIELPEELITDENSPQYVSFGRFTKNNIMMQMRKITNHPFLVQWPFNSKTQEVIVNKDIIKSSGKMRALDELLGQLFARKHRVLLFSQMTRMLDIIEEYCNYRRYRYLRLDGTTHLDTRRQHIEEFNKNSNIFLFLISTRAGGLGINLVGADTAIIYDSDWNPQMDLQAQDRCHRIGQSKPVIVYRLVTANTVDEKIVRTANSKRKLDKMIIQKGHFFRTSDQLVDNKSRQMSLEELLNVLQSTDFKAIYNYSSDKLESNRLYSDEDLKKMLDRTNPEESDDSIIEIGAQNFEYI